MRLRGGQATGRRGTFLVLTGAALGAVTLVVSSLARGQAPDAVGAPDVAPAGNTSSVSGPQTQVTAEFLAVAGPACPVDASRQIRTSSGWQVMPGGSWTQDGCGNRFLYTLSGDANYAQWLFTFDAPADRMCRIEVFVPDSPLSDAAVWYGITDRVQNTEYRIGGFSVDQEANRGQWVMGANVPVDTSGLLVNVDSGGQDPGQTGITAGPVRTTCTR